MHILRSNRELEFQTNPAGCFESLININKKLDQYDAASGLLKVVEQIQKKFPELKEVYAVQESWLAKLGHWDEALVKYNQKLVATPYDSAVLAGKMKCLDALGRWEEAIQVQLVFLFSHKHVQYVAMGVLDVFFSHELTVPNVF